VNAPLDQEVRGSSLPGPAAAPLAGDLIGAGLQLQYGGNVQSLSITLPGPNSQLTLLGVQAPRR
jgi:hypothetical protein